MRALLVLMALSLCGPTSAFAGATEDPPTQSPEPETAPETPPRNTTVGIAPSFAFNLDDGIGLGAWGDVRRDALPDEDRRHLANVGLNLKLWLKVAQVGWQVQVGLSWFPKADGRREIVVAISTFGRPQDWWFGVGMDAVRDLRFEDDEAKIPFTRHRFGLYRGRVSGHVFERIVGPVDAFVGGKFTHHVVQVREETLLEDTAASMNGIRGGPSLGIDVGLRIDSRDNRVDPTSGGFAVLLGQANLGPEDPWARGLFDLRGFVPIADAKIVLAGEVLIQAAVGDVPFYEQGVIGGWDVNERSFTGVLGLRAQDRGRLRGPLGLLGHGEIRIRPPGFQLLKKLRVRLAPTAWVDVARVDLLEPTPGGLPIQPSVGGGVRMFLNEVTAARLDIGTGPERVLDADGERTRWTFGIYGNVGHAF